MLLSISAALMRGDTGAIRKTIEQRGGSLIKVLDGAGLVLRGRNALFVLVENPDAADLHRHLCRHHILTRRFDYAPSWLRVGLASDEAGDARLAAALKDWRER